jgi:hypothetical protein
MLPDLRFALGATLAVAVLIVAGFGVVASVELVHQAQMGSLEGTQTLAYAGHAEWNQFYDPDNARRFVEATEQAKLPSEPASSEVAPASSPLPPPEAPQQQTADASGEQVEALPAGEKPEPTRPAADEAGVEPVQVAVAPAPPRETNGPLENATPGPSQTIVDPAKVPAVDDTAPSPKAKVRRKLARPHLRHPAPPPPQQTFQNVFQTSSSPWPIFGSSSPPATAPAKKTTAVQAH